MNEQIDQVSQEAIPAFLKRTDEDGIRANIEAASEGEGAFVQTEDEVPVEILETLQ